MLSQLLYPSYWEIIFFCMLFLVHIVVRLPCSWPDVGIMLRLLIYPSYWDPSYCFVSFSWWYNVYTIVVFILLRDYQVFDLPLLICCLDNWYIHRIQILYRFVCFSSWSNVSTIVAFILLRDYHVPVPDAGMMLRQLIYPSYWEIISFCKL